MTKRATCIRDKIQKSNRYRDLDSSKCMYFDTHLNKIQDISSQTILSKTCRYDQEVLSLILIVPPISIRTSYSFSFYIKEIINVFVCELYVNT